MKVCKDLTYFLDFIFYFLAHCIIFISLLEHDWAAIWRLECQPAHISFISLPGAIEDPISTSGVQGWAKSQRAN